MRIKEEPMGDSVKIDWNVEIPMRDGVVLRADVYRPDDSASHPVLSPVCPIIKTYLQYLFRS
jgi:predicted acyl esterase